MEKLHEKGAEQAALREAGAETDESRNSISGAYAGDTSAEYLDDGIQDSRDTDFDEKNKPEFYAEWTDIYKEARGYLYGTEKAQPDPEAAYEIMKEEAERGNAYAMHDMGKIYAQGIFVEPDQEKAGEWYSRALAAMLLSEERKGNTYLE